MTGTGGDPHSLPAARGAVLVADVFQHLHLAIVWEEFLFLDDIVRDFNARQVSGDFLVSAGLLALMRGDRDVLCGHMGSESLPFVE